MASASTNHRVNDAMLARIHFIVRTDPAARLGDVDAEHLSRRIADATRLWDDDFQFMLEEKLGEVKGHELLHRYRDALPQTYKDSHTSHEAVQDIAMLELLDEPDELVLHLFRRRKNNDDVRFKIFRKGEAMMLSDVLPVLHSLGVRVSDERPYEVRRADGAVHIYDFGLAIPPNALELASVRPKVENASPPRGGASRRWTGSTSWSCSLASPGGRWSSFGRTRSTSGRPEPSSLRSTWRRRLRLTRRSPPAS